MTHKFKPGDKIQCKDASLSKFLAPGGVYTVTHYNSAGGTVMLKEMPPFEYACDRFVHETATPDSGAGLKYDTGKIPYELIPPSALQEVAKVLQFGARKYSNWNWAKGIAYTRILGAILRHTFAYLSGETNDPETGLSHMAHAATECLFLLHFEKYMPELDDRYVPTKKEEGKK